MQNRSDLTGKVVVITGASSGLGRAASLELAREGARLVIASRRAETLENTAELCRQAGAEVLTVVTDVTDEGSVNRLATRAQELTGSIDVWVNNAGVTVFGSLEGTPLEDHRRVLETNLWGAVYGARAVVPMFRRQGYGVLLNVGSILGKVGQPFVPSYVISKFALRGLSEALRSELADCPGIHVCTLLPYAIDTPHFQLGANLVGRKPHAMPPVQSPEHVARQLVALIKKPRRELHVPRIAAVALAVHSLFPGPVERVIHDVLARFHFSGGQQLNTAGNLWAPSTEPPSMHGTRKPRAGLATVVGWTLGHFALRGLRALAG